MDPEKQNSSRPIIMPKPRRSGDKLSYDSNNSISREISPIISSQRPQLVPRRKTYAIGTKTPAKKLSEEKKLQTSKVVTASDECTSINARRHSSYANMCTRQSSEDMDKHKRDTVYWDLGSARLMAENFDLKNKLTCCLSEMNKLKQDLLDANFSLAMKVSEIERLQEEKCKVGECAKEMYRKQLEMLEQHKFLPEQQQKCITETQEALDINAETLLGKFTHGMEMLSLSMQESQEIRRAKTSELDILLYKQIPQIQLEFSEENAQLKHESEAKDQQIALLQRTLKMERCDLNHMTVEVSRLKSKRKNEQIKSLKERLAAVCDLHMVVLQQVEAQSKELVEERKHQMPLSKELSTTRKQLTEKCGQLEQERTALEAIGREKMTLACQVSLHEQTEENQSLVADKDALSIMLSKADRKISHINERLQESEKERADWELRAGHLEQLVEEARRTLDGQNEELSTTRKQLTEKCGQLEQERAALEAIGREKMTLACQVSLYEQTALIFEQDFRQERRDREQAHSKFIETEHRYKHQLDALSAESQEELNRHKKQCKDLESEYQARLSQLSYATGERDKKMAILEARNRELEKGNDSLQMHVIKKFELIKENIGKGSFGSVSLVRVGGMPCILKSLHDILLGQGNEEQVSVDQQSPLKEKFYQECNILWKLHHPNIVQFMGIHYSHESHNRVKKLSLIMEYLPTNLDECIIKCNEEKFTIPLSIKLSILRDVTYGLSQLHINDIVHRDLSAANVLLTSSLRAKIADFGVSRLMSPSSCLKLSRAPGAPYIMPPEALDPAPLYSIKLDIFSFGIMCIYLLLQEVPFPTDKTLEPHHLTMQQKEIGKRKNYLVKMDGSFAGMKAVASDCIQDLPEKRPAAEQLTKCISQCIQKSNLEILRDTIKFLNSTEVGRKLLISPEEL